MSDEPVQVRCWIVFVDELSTFNCISLSTGHPMRGYCLLAKTYSFYPTYIFDGNKSELLGSTSPKIDQLKWLKISPRKLRWVDKPEGSNVNYAITSSIRFLSFACCGVAIATSIKVCLPHNEPTCFTKYRQPQRTQFVASPSWRLSEHKVEPVEFITADNFCSSQCQISLKGDALFWIQYSDLPTLL